MSSIGAEDVRGFLLSRLQDSLSAKGLEPADVPDDFDLLTEGVIDSFGILEMISALEEEYGLEIDYEELDPEELTIIGPLCRFIERKSGDGDVNHG
jgi:acyl carrier protein